MWCLCCHHVARSTNCMSSSICYSEQIDEKEENKDDVIHILLWKVSNEFYFLWELKAVLQHKFSDNLVVQKKCPTMLHHCKSKSKNIFTFYAKIWQIWSSGWNFVIWLLDNCGFFLRISRTDCNVKSWLETCEKARVWRSRTLTSSPAFPEGPGGPRGPMGPY